MSLFAPTKHVATLLAESEAFAEWCACVDPESRIFFLTADRDLHAVPVGYRCAIVSPHETSRSVVTLSGDCDVSARVRVEFVEICDVGMSDRQVFEQIIDAIDTMLAEMDCNDSRVIEYSTDDDQPQRAGYGTDVDWASYSIVLTLDPNQEYES